MSDYPWTQFDEMLQKKLAEQRKEEAYIELETLEELYNAPCADVKPIREGR